MRNYLDDDWEESTRSAGMVEPTTEVALLGNNINNSSNITELGPLSGSPAEEMMRMVVQACTDAAVKVAQEPLLRKDEVEGSDGGGGFDYGTMGTIFATATVCYGLHALDCLAVKAYRHLKKWEWSMTDEQKGNLKRNWFVR